MLIKKIWKHRIYFRSILKSIYFNFHYLPFSQALHLPILLYKPKFKELKGKLFIEGGAKFGMIKMGFPIVSIYPNSGVLFENHGGTVFFHGSCDIGNNSSISVGEKALLEFGTRILATTTFRIVCYNKIIIGNNSCFGWDCTLMDTDLHRLSKTAGGYNKGYGEIVVGSNNWFGNGCLIMKNTETPNYCTISARTVLSKKVEAQEYCVIGHNYDIGLKAVGVWRNVDDDAIKY